MNVPDTISVQFSCPGCADLSGIICRIEIAAGTKNPYGILFPKTDTNGLARLSAEDVRGQFEDHWEAGLMDYNGTLESASSRVAVRLHDRRQAQSAEETLRAWPLLKHERTQWKNRDEFVDYLLSSRNDDFTLRLIYWNLEAEPHKNLTIRTSESEGPTRHG